MTVYSDRYIISLSPHHHTPLPLVFSPSLINLMVSVDVKHHVYFTYSSTAVSWSKGLRIIICVFISSAVVSWSKGRIGSRVNVVCSVVSDERAWNGTKSIACNWLCPENAGVKGNDRAHRLAAKQPSHVACFSEDLKCWEAWDTTCGHKAKDITTSIAWRREAWKEEALSLIHIWRCRRWP